MQTSRVTTGSIHCTVYTLVLTINTGNLAHAKDLARATTHRIANAATLLTTTNSSHWDKRADGTGATLDRWTCHPIVGASGFPAASNPATWLRSASICQPPQ